jgi:sugar phosphate permease
MRRLLPARIYYGWVMVASAFSINAVAATLNPVVFAFFIGPMSDDLGVSKSALSWALTFRLVAAGVTGPTLGSLIDRFGARWLGAGCAVVAGSMLIAVSFVHTLWLIYLVFAISGLAGLGGPAGQLLTQVPLAKWFVRQRGKALAIATMGLAGGTVVTIPITQALVDAIGWRSTSVIYGITVMAVAVPVSLLLVQRTPEDLGLYPDGADGPMTEAEENALSTLTTDQDWTVKEALRTPAMGLILAAMGLAGMALTGTLVHRVAYWESTGMSPTLVGFGTAIDPLAVVGSAFVFGMLADRVAIRYLGAAGLLGIGLSVVPMIYTSGQSYTIILHGFLWGAAAGGYITLNNIVWPNYFGRRAVGAIRGITLPVSIAASSLGAPVFGYLLDSGLDPAYVWLASSAMFIVSAGLVLIARPPRRAERASRPWTVAVEAEA